MAVAKNYYPAVIGKTFEKSAAMLSRFPLQGVCLGPIADGRLRFGQFVQNVDSDIAPRRRDGGGKPRSCRINIAPNCPHRCKDTELVQHGLRSNVTGVQDFVDATEKWQEMRIKEPVRVGDHTHSHKDKESEIRRQEPKRML